MSSIDAANVNINVSNEDWNYLTCATTVCKQLLGQNNYLEGNLMRIAERIASSHSAKPQPCNCGCCKLVKETGRR